MRKFLFALAVLAGGAAAATGAIAAPRAIPLAAAPAADGAALVQPVQYYNPGWRYREARRHVAYERFRHHEVRHEWHREHGFYGPRYGYGYGPRS